MPPIRWNVKPTLLLFITCLLTLDVIVNCRQQFNQLTKAQNYKKIPTKVATIDQQQQQHQQRSTTKIIKNKTITAATESIKNALASGLAAAVVKATLAPFDTIKTIQQHNRLVASEALSFWNAGRIATEKGRGIMGLYAGVGVTVVGAMPSVGLYFGVYSYSKRVIGSFLQETFAVAGDDSSSAGANLEKRKRLLTIITIATSAAIGNTIASSARVPYEVMKQKLQTGEYINTMTALRAMTSSPNPFRAFFPLGSISSQMVRDIPYAIVSLLTYEHLRENWVKKRQNPTIFHDMIAGAVAGGLGSYLTNPMDVIKTRLQTNMDYLGVCDCAMRIWKEEGYVGFLKGSKPRLMHKIPANGLFFVGYEFWRRVLRVEQQIQ